MHTPVQATQVAAAQFGTCNDFRPHHAIFIHVLKPPRLPDPWLALDLIVVIDACRARAIAGAVQQVLM